MRPTLTAEMAQAVAEDRIEAADRFRRAREARRASPEPRDVYDSVTVRLAGEDDAPALRRLAQRGRARVPCGPMLVAEVEHELLAARSLADGRALADPFRHTTHLTELLALRTAHLRDMEPALERRRLRGPRALARLLARSYS